MTHSLPTEADRTDRERRTGLQLQVSAYERVASTLIALLIMLGFLVLMLAVIVFTRRLVMRPPAIPVTLMEEFSGRGEHAAGTELDMEPPGIEEFPELSEPRVEELIDSISNVLAADAPSFDTLGTSASSGSSAGDRRAPGPMGDSDVIPRSQRWEVTYRAETLAAYARQLDFFGIELGVIGGGRQTLDYVSQLARPQPQVRAVKNAEKENRLYFSWRSGTLQAFDRQLASQAGVPVADRQVLQFFPPEVEQQLAALEQQAAGGRRPRDILKTRFAVRSRGQGFEFFVQDMEFRTLR